MCYIGVHISMHSLAPGAFLQHFAELYIDDMNNVCFLLEYTIT